MPRLPYNEILGVAPGNIPAYSNGSDHHWSTESHYYQGIFMGYKWQCVEYARRWLYLRKGLLFRSIPTAADMWKHLDSVERAEDMQQLPLRKYPNGSAEFPKVDTLLIYARSFGSPFGHVAVITEVTPNSVRIAEQNLKFEKWGGDYARELPLRQKDGRFWIEDRDKILGWIEVLEDESYEPGAANNSTPGASIQSSGCSLA